MAMDNVISDARIGHRASPAPYLLPFLSALALIGTLYYGTFLWWYSEWTAPGSFYAHAVFVPFFVAVMVWRNREKLAATPWRPSWVGAPFLLAAMGLLLMAERADVTIVKSLSFVMLLVGGTLMFLGIPRTRVLLFPLLFVIMMMPLIPDQLINGIAFPIQLLSAKLATMLLNLMTLTSVQQGTVIQMDNYKMSVELPCSGFKTLVSLLTFSAAFAYLVEAPLWKRWALFLTTVPLSLFINALRITFIGIVGELISTKAALTFHDSSGFIVLILAFLFLFNFARLLNCESFLGVPLRDVPAAPKTEGTEEAKPVDAKPAEPAWWQIVLAWRPTVPGLARLLPFALAANAVLLTTLAVRSSAIKTAPPQPPIATAQVPMEFMANGVSFKGVANAQTDKLPKDVQEVLNPTRVINRDYDGSDSSHLQLFITAGNGRKVFHDPHTCALGSNADIHDVSVTEIPTNNGVLRVQESRYKQKGMPEDFVMVFFYVVEGNVVQRTEQVRNGMIKQMVLGDSGKPSYFFRVMSRMPGSDESHRQQVLHFVAGLWNEVGPVLKGDKPALYEPPPVPTEENVIRRP